MHPKTLQIKRQVKRVLVGLSDAERRTVIRDLPEMVASLTLEFGSATADHPYPAKLVVSPDFILILVRTKQDSLTEKIGEGKLLDIELHHCIQIDKIKDGLQRVQFDFENYEYKAGELIGRYQNLLGPRYFGKIPGIGCAAGGDWEYPVFFVIYLDEDGQTLRAYVPKEGNVWNHNKGEAFGNDEGSDSKFLGEWVMENCKNIDKVAHARIMENPTDHAEIMFDEERILKDIEEALTVLETAR